MLNNTLFKLFSLLLLNIISSLGRERKLHNWCGVNFIALVGYIFLFSDNSVVSNSKVDF